MEDNTIPKVLLYGTLKQDRRHQCRLYTQTHAGQYEELLLEEYVLGGRREDIRTYQGDREEEAEEAGINNSISLTRLYDDGGHVVLLLAVLVGE